MNVTRRIAIGMVAALAAVTAPALAQEWPTRPITILVGYPAGGANDLVARALTEGLSQRLGQSVVVENRPGAAGLLAAEATTRAEPDGYTLYMISSAQTLAPSLHDVTFDPTAFEAIKIAASGSYLLLVRPDLEADNVEELIELARSRPGDFTYASSGVGAGPHLTAALFMSMADIDVLHVPYAGDSPVLVDLLGGHVDMSFVAIAPSQQYVADGSLRALAISGAQRHASFPDLPTVEEAAGFEGFDMGAWWGLVAPQGTPREIIEKVEAAAAETLASESVQNTLTELGFVPGDMTSSEFQTYLGTEVEKFAEIVRQADISIE